MTELPDSARPFEGAKLFRSVNLGPLSFQIGDIVELEDDDESSELPLLGLVQCIFEGGDSSDIEIQVAVPCSLAAAM